VGTKPDAAKFALEFIGPRTRGALRARQVDWSGMDCSFVAVYGCAKRKAYWRAARAMSPQP